MDSVSRDKIKEKSFKRFINSFEYSVDGLKYAYKNEQSMSLHLITTFLIISLGIFFKIEILEWAICAMVLGLVAATELVNTSIEAVVDLITQERHPLAKVAKDTASAAVFIFSFMAFICCLIIFIPEIIAMVS